MISDALSEVAWSINLPIPGPASARLPWSCAWRGSCRAWSRCSAGRAQTSAPPAGTTRRYGRPWTRMRTLQASSSGEMEFSSAQAGRLGWLSIISCFCWVIDTADWPACRLERLHRNRNRKWRSPNWDLHSWSYVHGFNALTLYQARSRHRRLGSRAGRVPTDSPAPRHRREQRGSGSIPYQEWITVDIVYRKAMCPRGNLSY